MAEDVYCTLLMSDSYLPGAAVLAHSLRDGGTTKKLAVLITIDSLLASTVAELHKLYDYVITVDRIANPSLENLYRLGRLDLRFAFTKIALWRLQQFRKVVYIDADVVALRAPDELFAIHAAFAAAPDIGWPDIFNSGVMLLTPSMSEYWSLQALASSGTSFDGADQGLLNEYFANRPWHRLSFTYNCTPSASYQYEPAYRHFRSSINMVHFIGKDKPWTQGREALKSGDSGVYKELLGRWWSVFDLHYRSTQSSAFGQIAPDVKTVQQYVRGEDTQTAFSWASDGLKQQPLETRDTSRETRNTSREPPEASAVSTEPLMTEPGEEAENIDSGVIQPIPTEQQRTFSAPQMDWDATRSEPPVESKPEASNFPSQRYEMSHDPGLFHAPTSYPAPPPEAAYEIPATKPAVYEKPKAIFPWEKTAKAPTRVFADDLPDPLPGPISPSTAGARSVITEPGTAPIHSSASNSPSTPTIKVIPTDPWHTFSRTNAWDEDNSIDGYVRAMKLAQQRRGQVQVLHQASPEIGVKDFAGSISSPPIARRRESLILTDFPTEIERPSLPVTPAPIQRSSFWGEERDDSGNLPVAEGVPEQVDWNPVERLEELRRASIVATGELPLLQQRSMPERDMPSSSRPFGSSPPVSPSAMAQGVPLEFSAGTASSHASGHSTFSTSEHSTFTAQRIDPNVTHNIPAHLGEQLPPIQEQQGFPLRLDLRGSAPSQAASAPSAQGRSDDVGPFDEYSIA